MGEDICRGNARFPGMSPDSQYFIFISSRTGLDYYWISAEIIERLRPKVLKHQ